MDIRPAYKKLGTSTDSGEKQGLPVPRLPRHWPGRAGHWALGRAKLVVYNRGGDRPLLAEHIRHSAGRQSYRPRRSNDAFIFVWMENKINYCLRVVCRPTAAPTDRIQNEEGQKRTFESLDLSRRARSSRRQETCRTAHLEGSEELSFKRTSSSSRWLTLPFVPDIVFAATLLNRRPIERANERPRPRRARSLALVSCHVGSAPAPPQLPSFSDLPRSTLLRNKFSIEDEREIDTRSTIVRNRM